LTNSSTYNLYIHRFCWCFGNCCCLCRNDCPSGGQKKLYFDEFVNLLSYVSTYESIQRQRW